MFGLMFKKDCDCPQLERSCHTLCVHLKIIRYVGDEFKKANDILIIENQKLIKENNDLKIHQHPAIFLRDVN